ncbi:MAG: ATP-binding protein [Dehalococcoidia bacterium]|jgi:two-component system phosphate regulon sensor histidine kinase PhoR
MLASIRVRIAAYVLLIVAALAGLGLFVIHQVDSDMHSNTESYLASEAQIVANSARPLLESGAPQSSFEALAKQVGAGVDTRVTIIAPDGTVLGDSEADPATMENHAGRLEFLQAMQSGSGKDERSSATLGVNFSYVAQRVDVNGSPAAVVRVARPLSAINDTLSSIRRSLLVAIALTAALAALLSLIIAGTIIRPLNALSAAARGVARGDLTRRVKPRPSGEIGEVADAFNQMTQSVEGLVDAASKERSRLTAVLDSGSDAVLAVDAETRVTFASRAVSPLLEKRPDEAVGNPFVWTMPDEQAVQALHDALNTGQARSLVIERPKGRFLQVSAAPIAGGGDWVALVVFHDVTEGKRVEDTRRDFIANVSHELRTPLASIKSVVETLQAGAIDDKAAAQDFLARADAEVDRLVQMVTELLELSRLESGQAPLAREPVDVGRMLAQAVERMRPQADRKSLELTLNVGPDVPSISGDAQRLEQTLVNLIDNAIKFTPEGGAVRVSAKSIDGFVEIDVEDTGDGISTEKVPRIFERFYKVDRARGDRGTGLGLAVVKHTVEAHGGTVRVRSQEGRGSIFTLVLPAQTS